MAKNTNTTNTNIINKVTKPFAKGLTILDLVARLALGIAVWFVPVPNSWYTPLHSWVLLQPSKQLLCYGRHKNNHLVPYEQ